MAAVVQYTEGNRTAYFFLIYVNVIMVTATTWKSEVSSCNTCSQCNFSFDRSKNNQIKNDNNKLSIA